MGITGINTMQAMISASSAMVQVQRQGSVAANMRGREGVLETEIKLDTARGVNVEKKQEELEEVQKKLTQVQSTQMDTLTDASKKLEEARKADQKAEAEAKKKSDKKEEAKKEDKNDTVVSEEHDKTVSNADEKELTHVEVQIETPETDILEKVNISVQENMSYPHVDIRL